MPDGLLEDDIQIKAPALDAAQHPSLRGVTADKGSGVVGVSHSKKSLGLLGGSDRVFRQSAGVYGESIQQGVFGHSTDPTGTGVYGNSVGSGFGVRGESTDGIAVQGQSFGGGLAGKFIGNVEVTDNLVVQGRNINALFSQIQSLGNLVGRVQGLEGRVQTLEQENQRLKQEIAELKNQSSGGKLPAGSPNPQISVTKKDGKFVVTGSGFLASTTISIRVVDTNQPQSYFTYSQSSESDGALNFQQSISCVMGASLSFSASDGRVTSGNQIWSNIFRITC
ncbi:hypothetical protein [Leptolyngbya sp. NIES-2104]|uniref:hypothetical protein n=1 Tax=Leptolyngbya sp. NIES-2104 TaxID=1552121 RepID=UPI0006EC7382|nr:hypothetical protein [Leptolyngbya sp. NIES-2104]GAP98433.1 hypothetical protein NIES2104_49880 [Leptolyngbya sp. NIES-2104]